MIRRPPRSTLSSSSAASDVYKRQVYKRYLTVQNRTVEYPDGSQFSFDIVGHAPSCRFVTVFPYNPHTQQVTVIREWQQGPNQYVYTLPTGGFDPRRHSDPLAAAQAELSEEAGLTGGEWEALLPAGRDGIWESKWCSNAFYPFLVVQPEVDTNPGARDLEEQLMTVHTMSINDLMQLLYNGELAVCSVTSVMMALSRLRDKGYDVSAHVL
eukprot:TRINITY_DN1927_c0_g1_i3.p1 TRINITY_DN1927_c0_g1~~TRINITY_DN1927_c0_g1_i3.p1  ORF type:complete len:211 (-),score=38.72 TRINITY_DN1927_c0_g1_i3:53-685(-)